MAIRNIMVAEAAYKRVTFYGILNALNLLVISILINILVKVTRKKYSNKINVIRCIVNIVLTTVNTNYYVY